MRLLGYFDCETEETVVSDVATGDWFEGGDARGKDCACETGDGGDSFADGGG